MESALSTPTFLPFYSRVIRTPNRLKEKNFKSGQTFPPPWFRMRILFLPHQVKEKGFPKDIFTPLSAGKTFSRFRRKIPQ